MLLGLLGNAAALIGFGLAQDYAWLIIARGAAGIASAAVLPSVMAYVADVTTSEERGKGMGLMGAAMGLGFILGPALGGIMGSHDTPFFVAGGLSLVNFLFVLTLLPESLQKVDAHEEDEAHHEWISPREIFRWTTLKSPFNSLFLVAFFTAFTMSGLETTFPLFIEKGWDYRQREMGWMFMIMGAVVVPIQGVLLGRLINRFGGTADYSRRAISQRPRSGTFAERGSHLRHSQSISLSLVSVINSSVQLIRHGFPRKLRSVKERLSASWMLF